MVFLTITITMMLAVPLLPAAAQGPDDKDAVFNGGFEIAAREARPVVCEVFGEGYINVFDPDNPFGLPWLVALNPCHSSALKAAGWSSGMTTEIEDDGTGNHVARFIAGSTDENTGATHNMWQAYPNAHQAYTGNFSRYELKVLEGTVPSGASIILSFSTSPVADPHPYVGIFFECDLTFRGSLLTPDNGTISIDPTEGTFRSRYAGDEVSTGCDGLRDAWYHENATAEDRREILDGLRIIQNSFWRWNSGSDDVVIDDVSMRGSRVFPQALL